MSATNISETYLVNAFGKLYAGHSSNRLLAGQIQFNESLNAMTFGSTSLVHRLNLSNGTVFRQDIDLDDLDVHQAQGHCASVTTTGEGKNTLSVYILKHSRHGFQVSRQAFVRLLETCRAPAHYLDLLDDDNGVFSSYMTHDSDERILQDYYMLVKLPFGPHVNGSLMFRHSFKDDHTDCIVSVQGAWTFCERFAEFDLTKCLEARANNASPRADPFLILALAMEHISTCVERERADIDRRVCLQEGKSGVALHNFNARGRAKVTEYAVVLRDLHMLEGLLSMFEHILSFQVEFSSFLVQEFRTFCQFRLQDGERRGINLGSNPEDVAQRDHVQASLSNQASKARWRSELVKVLSKRIQIQIKVVESSTSSYDTLIALRLARDSRNDGVAMKAITLLTMAFLPATFVATIFSMGFFHFAPKSATNSNEVELKVTPQVWMYVAVTVPLTVVVVGACATWLKWNEWRMNARWGKDQGGVE